jgi:uncharacterized protein
MTSIDEAMLKTLIPGKILSVQVGFSRTAILADTDDGIRCGLAATLSNKEFKQHRQPAVCNAGRLHEMHYTDLANLINSQSYTETAIGLATINALLPRNPDQWLDLNAEELLLHASVNKNVAVIGHFPFVERLRPIAKNCWVLELNPQDGDLPACHAPQIIPKADVVAITATTLINKTFQGLMSLCKADATVVLIGPSTPLSPVLFDFGIDVISGTIVVDPKAALMGIGQGITIHQLHQAGIVRLVTLMKDGINGRK